MFKFNFGQILDYPIELDDDRMADDEEEIIISPVDAGEDQSRQPLRRPQDVCEEISLDTLIATLSPIISYTPLIIRSKKDGDTPSLAREHSIILPRRDLYDARFQIISEGALSDDEEEEDPMEVEDEHSSNHVLDKPNPGLPPTQLAYIDAPSDVIPDVYEGGLKTWECSIDVVEYLSNLNLPFQSKAILEVGCGTAIPTAYLLQTLFNSTEPPAPDKYTIIHLQDYNKSVLELVTLPNLILGWYSSLAAHPYRNTLALPTPDPEAREAPGELPITPELIAAFHQSLQTHNIQLRFWAGSWSSFNPRQPIDPAFDVIITSETIYRSANVSSLLSVLRSASGSSSFTQPSPSSGFFAGLMGRAQEPQPLILVAAKVLYFGVGGSVDEFKTMAQNAGAIVTTVLDIEMGVGRRILKLEFT